MGGLLIECRNSDVKMMPPLDHEVNHSSIIPTEIVVKYCTVSCCICHWSVEINYNQRYEPSACL